MKIFKKNRTYNGAQAIVFLLLPLESLEYHVKYNGAQAVLHHICLPSCLEYHVKYNGAQAPILT